MSLEVSIEHWGVNDLSLYIPGWGHTVVNTERKMSIFTVKTKSRKKIPTHYKKYEAPLQISKL
jgi:hypothetical protein